MPGRGGGLRLVPALHRAVHQVGLHLLSWRPHLGVTQGEAHILAHLHEVSRCSIGDLHLAFAHRRSTLTSILDRLVARALVRRDLDPRDRRRFDISLTPSGSRLARSIHRALDAIEKGVVEQVGHEGLTGFERILAALDTQMAGHLRQPLGGRSPAGPSRGSRQGRRGGGPASRRLRLTTVR